MTSAPVGASRIDQLEANLAALDNVHFSVDELTEIDEYATEANINLWASSSA